jgi:transcriptional regulator with XRE-family HTH domain
MMTGMEDRAREVVRQQRLRQGWSYRQAAARAQIGAQAWQHFEEGATEPSTHTLLAIARAFGWPGDWRWRLANGEDPDAWSDPVGEDLSELRADLNQLREVVDALLDQVAELATRLGQSTDAERGPTTVRRPGRASP